ncbi:YgaP family membrane protein [Alteribacter populi]|uniref:YgaP family membrane protein n=1 Tax=Alteribacter populi TaxID=2011011 RepID=UPI000BBAEFE1|nr:DUF2892 domain-containing protein [Alteribacter populi]
MRPNIGMINALVRITCGFTLLAWATARLVRRPYRSSPLFVAMMGAMKVAEGITRFCPVTFAVEERMEETFDDIDFNHDSGPVNPS